MSEWVEPFNGHSRSPNSRSEDKKTVFCDSENNRVMDHTAEIFVSFAVISQSWKRIKFEKEIT